jgi:hypothetical protein
MAVLVSLIMLSGCARPEASNSSITSIASESSAFASCDKDAVVMSISATFESCMPDSGKPDVVSFVFIRPSGKRTSVDILDTNPPELVHLEAEYDQRTPPLPQEELQQFAEAIDAVKVGPREVCQSVWPEIQEH